MTHFGPRFNCRTGGFTFDSRLLQYTEEFMVDRKVPRSCGCKTSPNIHSSTTVIGSWHKVFEPIFCVWFSPNVVLSIMAKHLHFGLICTKDIVPEVMCFIHRHSLPRDNKNLLSQIHGQQLLLLSGHC
ncbi:hypothetical protein CHARACLAT_004448 [Characodon lateralis]|uniref:Uncharacterized protein n=1 Tax=Characodon lateralis TaxID=208331 RepID=A0ABU7D759_9TELE|nr:hypothetical protein [Characodon lateralis]